MSGGAQWSDLAPRVMSGVAMLGVGALALYLGGLPFTLLLWMVCALMIWELARMFDATFPVGLAALGPITLLLAEFLPIAFGSFVVIPLLVAAVMVAMGQVKVDRVRFGAYLAWIIVGCFAMLLLRLQGGLAWGLWLVLVVVASDVAGYFAGRSLGGPKFWPAISPKKTWSGTIAGWLGAAVIGLLFMGPTGAGWTLVPLSVLAGFAGQMGDIAESAIKRRKGVKDSSELIPGHGGVMDRFDAMLGAAVFVFLVWALGLVPGLV